MNLSAPLRPEDLEPAFALYRLSRMLYVVAELGIAPLLADGPRGAAELARLTATDDAALASVLDALASRGVFVRDSDGRYALNDVSRRLVPGSPDAANLPFLLGWAGWPPMYDAFGNLMHTLRTGRSAMPDGSFHGCLAARPDMARRYDEAMTATADGFRGCAEAFDFGGARTIVDVGGGRGAFCLEILKRHPGLRAISFDLPAVVAAGADAVHERLTLVGGDAFERVPEGADVYLTSTVLRCFDDRDCVRLLRRMREAMPDDGRLVAFEIVMPESRDDPVRCAADVVARAVYGGRDRTEREFRGLFAAAQLRLLRSAPAHGAISLLEALAA